MRSGWCLSLNFCGLGECTAEAYHGCTPNCALGGSMHVVKLIVIDSDLGGKEGRPCSGGAGARRSVKEQINCEFTSLCSP